MPGSPGRKLATHVQAAIAAGQGVGQAKSQQGGGQKLAAHVHSGIATGQGVGQAKMEGQGGQVVAAHVQAAITAGQRVGQAKVGRQGGGQGKAAHVQAAIAAGQAKVAGSKAVADVNAGLERQSHRPHHVPSAPPLVDRQTTPAQASLALPNRAVSGVQLAPSNVLGSPIVQCMELEYECDICDKKFATKKGLNIHVGMMHKKRKEAEGVEDEISDWSSDTDAEVEGKFYKNIRKGSNQAKYYKKHKHDIRNDPDLTFHSSEGLSEAVFRVGSGGKGSKESGQHNANTHLLVTGADGVRAMLNMSTLSAMSTYASRYKAVTLSPTSNVFGKKQHVHAEMHLLFLLTEGVEEDIKGCMEGMHLVVDKPICQDCYPYVLLAGPSKVDDSTDFLKDDETSAKRGKWDTWRSPFLKKFSGKVEKLGENPFEQVE